MYRIFIETHFASSHQLHGYEGKCRVLHGHTWKVRVDVVSDQINEIGISYDFKALKSVAESVIQKLDHTHINQVPPFDKENPTAENIARFIYREIKSLLPSPIGIQEVTVWESDSHGVSYSET